MCIKTLEKKDMVLKKVKIFSSRQNASQTKSEKTSNSCSATSGFSALMVSQLYQ
jgi:hypothetical protein